MTVLDDDTRCCLISPQPASDPIGFSPTYKKEDDKLHFLG